MDQQVFVYVAYAPCGCISGAVFDRPGHEDITGHEVGKMIAHGSRIERHAGPVDIGGDCPHTPKWGRAELARPEGQ